MDAIPRTDPAPEGRVAGSPQASIAATGDSRPGVVFLRHRSFGEHHLEAAVARRTGMGASPIEADATLPEGMTR